MPKKVLVLTLISLLVLSVSVFGAMKPKVEDDIMRNRLEKMNNQDYPNESIVSKYLTTPTPKLLGPMPSNVVGFTYYDYQHNDVMRRMIANGTVPDNNIHVTWQHSPDILFDDRYVNYNSYVAGTWLISGGMNVTPQAGRGGYTGLDLLPDQREVLCYHRTQPTPNNFWGTAISIEVGDPGDGTFESYDIPDSVEGTTVNVKGEWPTVACAKVGGAHNYIHITHAEGVTGGSDDKDLFYVRCYEGGSGKLICESPGWATPDTITKEIRLVPNRVCYKFDISRLGGVPMATSPVSQKIAIVWLDNYANSQTQNELKYMESTNNGQNWINDPDSMVPVQLTSYQAGGGVDRAYDDIAVIYDYMDNLHIMWTTMKETNANDVTLWHWSPVWGIRKAGFASAASSTDPGAWNVLIAKFNLGMYLNPPETVLYVNYTKFRDGDVSDGGFANGDLVAKGSTNLGKTWGPEVNMTKTTSDSCLPGNCQSEHWSSLAERVDDFLHISYIFDKDPAGWVTPEGTGQEDTVIYLKYPRFTIPSKASLTYSPTSMISPYRHAVNGGSTSENIKFDNVGTTTLYVNITGPTWVTSISPSNFSIEEAGPTQTVNVTLSGVGKTDTMLVDSLKIESNDTLLGTNVKWIKIHFIVTDTLYYAEWDTVAGTKLKAVVSNVGNIGNQTEDYQMNFNGADFLFDFSPALVTPDVMGQGPVGFTWLHDHHDFLAEGNVETDDQYYDSLGVIIIYDKFAIPLPGRVSFHRTYWPWWGYWTKYSKIIIQPDVKYYSSNWIKIYNWWMYNPPPVWWDNIPGGYPTTPAPGYFGIVGDWDVPADASGKNVGGYDSTLNLIYQYADTVGFTKYYGGFQFLSGKVTTGGSTTNYTKPLGAHVLNNAEQLYPFRGYNDDSLSKYMAMAGWSGGSDSAQDMNIVMSMVQVTNPNATTVIELEYALLVSDQGLDSLKATARKMRILTGDANGDFKVSVSDVVYLINYLFKGGPPPVYPSDVNRDGKISVSDVVYLINYLFKGGPPPKSSLPWNPDLGKLPPW